MRCPACGTKITVLLEVKEISYRVYRQFDLGGYDDYSGPEPLDSKETDEVTLEGFWCRECKTKLAETEEEAARLLRGEISSDMAEKIARIAFDGRVGKRA